jgi:LemA protein
MTAGADVASRAAAENQLTSALRSLFAIAEAYPDLKASQNFALLQEELASTENRLAFARQHYNDATMAFNTARDSLPAVAFAGLLGFGHADHLVLDNPAAQDAPVIDFSGNSSRGDLPQLP